MKSHFLYCLPGCFHSNNTSKIIYDIKANLRLPNNISQSLAWFSPFKEFHLACVKISTLYFEDLQRKRQKREENIRSFARWNQKVSTSMSRDDSSNLYGTDRRGEKIRIIRFCYHYHYYIAPAFIKIEIWKNNWTETWKLYLTTLCNRYLF